MRYSFTTLACVALAATSFAAPVIDKRARDIKIFTEYTTIVTTQTITRSNAAESTAAVQVESYNNRKYYHSNRLSSSSVAPAVPTSTVQPITLVSSVPAIETTAQATSIAVETTPIAIPAPVTTYTPEPETITTTIQPETTSTPVVVSTAEPETTTIAPTTTTAAAIATATSSSFEAAVLAAHNDKRALHGVPALVYDATMAAYAQALSAKCVFAHSGGPYGENLAAGYATPAAAIEAWYDEESLYDYAAGQFSKTTGHFTQMVWKSATKVGCGIADCSTADTPGQMLTCEYDTGNVQGQFIANVLPLTS